VPSVAHIRCSGCEAAVIVLPDSLAEVTGADHGALAVMLGQLDDDKGNRYALAEPDGRFVCPSCKMPGCAVTAREPSRSGH
jgi:hypothetical protein